MNEIIQLYTHCIITIVSISIDPQVHTTILSDRAFIWESVETKTDR